MCFIRGRFFGRFLSVFFLLLFVHSLFTPYYALALTSGPHQPEYTSYEDPHSTDMVNLLTGDFNFNIPILEVPGPEGNFSLPLSYHAGIGLEQEASWVGLGFNVNAGAILRTVNQYPDDATGEDFNVTVQDLTGVTGWNRLFNHPFKDDWNSQTGYHGNVNLLDIVDVHFGNRTSVGVVGVHVGDGGVSFDAVQFTNSLMTIASYGAAAAGTSAVAVAKQAAVDLAVNTAVSFAMPINSPSAPTAGNWEYSKSSRTSYDLTHNSWLSLALSLPIHSRKKSWKMWLNQTRIEDMYGVLYLGDAPVGGTDANHLSLNGTTTGLKQFQSGKKKGTGSDINFSLDNSISHYSLQRTPITLASDNYMVNAPGVSGSITPYRLEVGSVTLPKEMTDTHIHYAPLPHLNYKVPFIYEGTINNKYFNHLGASTGSPTVGTFNYGLNYDHTNYVHALSDVVFSSNRIHSDNNAIKKIPQGNNIEWFTNDEIKNTLSSTSQLTPNNFIDFLSAAPTQNNDYITSERYKFRSNYTIGTNAFFGSHWVYMQSFGLQIPIASQDSYILSQLTTNSTVYVVVWDMNTEGYIETSATVSAKNSNSITLASNTLLQTYIGKEVNISIAYPAPQMQKGIGGYSITAQDGTTYHFALPVYDFDYQSTSINVSDDKKKSIITRTSPFANTWLLTSITGPDFVDRNSNGLADDEDWGYWVKMNYGKHTDSFDWRIPYSGYLNDATGTYKGYESGKKQLYYLNSIETRSHVALFMKSNREDGKNASGTIVPLKLDEICLLRKEIYKKIIVAPYSTADFTNRISSLCLSSSYATASIRDYINRNCNKRIVFNYSYDLCKNTDNAGGTVNTQKGKLTLKSVSIKGRNDLKVVPDYKFEYTSNPNYSVNAWDGWGMYQPGGTAAATSHKTNDPTGVNGPAWSLAKVTTPLGSDILINYERDTYSSVSGQMLFDTSVPYSKINYTVYYPSGSYTEVPLSSTAGFAKDDLVRVEGDIRYKCYNSSVYTTNHYKGDYKIVSVSATGIVLNGDFSGVSSCAASPGSMYVDTHSGSVTKILTQKPGGNIRVASITMRDEFGKENKMRYLYNKEDGSSSGVVAQEPDYIRTTTFPFYDQMGYPQTPVMYGRVSVLNGILSTDEDYYSKQVFEFEMPNTSHLVTSKNDQGSYMLEPGEDSYSRYVVKTLYQIENRTSKIGRLNSIKVFDKQGVTSQSELQYTDAISTDGTNKYQGVFTEGLILDEYTDEKGYGVVTNRVERTTVVTYPYTLKKIINTNKEGFSSSTENKNWDLFTGMVTERLDKSSLGVYVKSVIQPAYKVSGYEEMGSKALNINNKNMLIQNAATYTYLSDASGSNLGLIDARAQMWKKDWTKYRSYNGTAYTDEGVQTNPIWRKGPLYVWKGDLSRLKNDGTHTFSSSDEFKFSGSNPLWFYKGEPVRFDHYGMPLEAVDENNFSASIKMGYNDRTVLAQATNARYNEIAFSSAEDKISNIDFFSSEVRTGAGTIVTQPTHTGNKALSVVAGSGATYAGKGFIFRTTEATIGKVYKASVWANSLNGRIYYRINDGTEVIPTQSVSAPISVDGINWYRIDVIIPKKVVTSAIIEVGVKSQTGTVVFDDFRFQPADATMTCYVYPPLDYEFVVAAPAYSAAYSYVLDNDNLFTKYEYNERGELVKVYNESLRYGVKQVSESKINYRRSTINP